MQYKSLAQAKEVATHAARFRPGYWCFCGPGSDKNWTYNEERSFHELADGDKLPLSVISELFFISKHTVFKCSNLNLSNVVMLRKIGDGVGMHIRKEPENHLSLANRILACTQFFSQCKLDSTQDACFDLYLHSRIKSGSLHSVSSPQTTILCSW